MKKTGFLFLCFALLFSGLAFAEPDFEGCTDHPLFTRMKNYYISACEKNFDQALIMINEEPDSPENLRPEGDKTFISYQYPESVGSSASYLQIRRNYQNAGKKLKAKILVDRDRYTAMQIDQNGSRIYVGLELFNDGRNISLTILEQKSMVQDVVANGESFTSDIKSTRHAAMVPMNSTENIGVDQPVNVGKDSNGNVEGNNAVAITTEYSLNGKKIALTADDEITFKTGSAKIIMKKDGTIIIEGKDIFIKGTGKINIKSSGDIVLKGSKITQN